MAAVVFDNDILNENLIDMVGDNSDRTSNISCAFLSYIGELHDQIQQSLEKRQNGLKSFALINIPLNMTFTNENSLRRAPWSDF